VWFELREKRPELVIAHGRQIKMIKYLHIKRSNLLSDAPSSIISLEEFKTALSHIDGVEWGRERDGQEVRNSDGSKVKLEPGEGLVFQGANKNVHLVYPFRGGIAIHTEQNPDTVTVANALAELLKAGVFPV
jgi:hypothetical protein